MKIHKLKLTVLLSAIFALSSLNAGIRFKNIYQNDMVLQAGEENIVAGVSSRHRCHCVGEIQGRQGVRKKFESKGE